MDRDATYESLFRKALLSPRRGRDRTARGVSPESRRALSPLSFLPRPSAPPPGRPPGGGADGRGRRGRQWGGSPVPSGLPPRAVRPRPFGASGTDSELFRQPRREPVGQISGPPHRAADPVPR